MREGAGDGIRGSGFVSFVPLPTTHYPLPTIHYPLPTTMRLGLFGGTFVYFEGGYAMGMGLPVIWTCHKDHIKTAHFDTNHLNHIVWDDVGEFRTSLANRILATIGRGPKEKSNPS